MKECGHVGLFFNRKNKKKDAVESSKPIANKASFADDKNQHINDISNRFIARMDWEAGDLAGLSISDLCLLIKNANWAAESHLFPDADKRMPAIVDIFQMVLIEKMKSADVSLVIIDEATGYPFIDEADRIWMFSEKEYADNAVKHFEQQHRSFKVEEVANSRLTAFFAEIFYTAGAQGVLMNNGISGCNLPKEALLLSPQWKDAPQISVPVMNPDFMRAHLKMTQEAHWPVNYENREQVLDRLELELCRQLMQTKLLIPTKGMPSPTDGSHSIILEKDTTISIPCLMRQDGSKDIPAFTDWNQFRICYSDKEFSGMVLPFADLMEWIFYEKRYSAAIINMGKCPLALDEKSLQRIRSVAAQAG